MTSDAVLIKEVKRGNNFAFTVVYDRYYTCLYAFAYKYVGCREQAEDIVQHTFLKLWEKKDTIDTSCNLRSFLYAITKNYTLNSLRNTSTAVHKITDYGAERGMVDDGMMADIQQRDMAQMLDSAIEKLPPQKRTICRLKINSGMSNQEIASQLNISVNTVKVLYGQAIRMLRACMVLVSMIFYN